MKYYDECSFDKILADGRIVIKLGTLEQKVKLYGIEIPLPVSQSCVDYLTRLVAGLRRPLRCIQISSVTSGETHVKLYRFGWQDKSGDVWMDLCVDLIDEGLARVSSDDFMERDEYLQHEEKALLRQGNMEKTSEPE